MNHFLLLEELQEKHRFSETEFTKLLELFEKRCFKKNEIVFLAGEEVKYVYFILKGCFRQYFINEKGVERTIYFSEEKQWATELHSFLYHIPTKMNVQALEDSEVLAINYDNWYKAITTFPDFAFYHIKNHQKIVAFLKEELGAARTESIEEKYLRFVKEKPHLMQRLPLFHIALYLGTTPETISRVRKKLSYPE